MTVNNLMVKGNRGFTLLEVLIVGTIVGILLAVIIPRAQMARVAAKYNVVRQSAGELGRWANEWVERNRNSQPVAATCRDYRYADTLASYFTAENTKSNWNRSNTNTINNPTASCGAAITAAVQEIMPEDKPLKNPFNGLSYFNPANDPTTVVPGALKLASFPATPAPGDTVDYYFIYLGTSSTSITTFYGGMGDGSTLANLRNGVFMSQLQVP
ncbi:MAG: type II secretion system protein [Deltaproteobacteria bacterium]|nr:type II secretion system protein [Deltaproteobacteria bacterium]